MEHKISILFFSRISKKTKENLVPIYLRIAVDAKHPQTSKCKYAICVPVQVVLLFVLIKDIKCFVHHNFNLSRVKYCQPFPIITFPSITRGAPVIV